MRRCYVGLLVRIVILVAALVLCGAVSADCDTGVAASVLCGAVSADCNTGSCVGVMWGC